MIGDLERDRSPAERRMVVRAESGGKGGDGLGWGPPGCCFTATTSDARTLRLISEPVLAIPGAIPILTPGSASLPVPSVNGRLFDHVGSPGRDLAEARAFAALLPALEFLQ